MQELLFYPWSRSIYEIMMSAGEASGDMHAAAVAAEIKREYPDADIFGMGGDNMRNAGVRIIYDIGNLGIIGVVEVIRHLSLFLSYGHSLDML